MDLNAERGGPRGRHTESVFNKLHFCSVSLQPARIDDNDDAEAAMRAHTQREEKNRPSIYHRFPIQCIRCVSPLQPLTLPPAALHSRADLIRLASADDEPAQV